MKYVCHIQSRSRNACVNEQVAKVPLKLMFLRVNRGRNGCGEGKEKGQAIQKRGEFGSGVVVV